MYHQAQVCSMSHYQLKTNCVGCNHLKNTWYGYLEMNGFIDAEKNHKPFDDAKKRRNPQHVKEVTDYYYWATQALHMKTFKSQTDETIWQYYVNGATALEISNAIGLERSWVSRKIGRIEKSLKEK